MREARRRDEGREAKGGRKVELNHSDITRTTTSLSDRTGNWLCENGQMCLFLLQFKSSVANLQVDALHLDMIWFFVNCWTHLDRNIDSSFKTKTYKKKKHLQHHNLFLITIIYIKKYNHKSSELFFLLKLNWVGKRHFIQTRPKQMFPQSPLVFLRLSWIFFCGQGLRLWGPVKLNARPAVARYCSGSNWQLLW